MLKYHSDRNVVFVHKSNSISLYYCLRLQNHFKLPKFFIGITNKIIWLVKMVDKIDFYGF